MAFINCDDVIQQVSAAAFVFMVSLFQFDRWHLDTLVYRVADATAFSGDLGCHLFWPCSCNRAPFQVIATRGGDWSPNN